MDPQAQNRPRVSHLRAEAGDAGQRIDNFLVRILKGVPRSHVYRILRRGEVRVNGGRVRAAYRLEAGDEIRVPPVRRPDRSITEGAPGYLLEKLEKAVLYEDKDLLAINKPSGIAVHGGSGLSHGVIEALREMHGGQGELDLVHRLDRDTSGCLLVAKRRSALRRLHALLRGGQVEKHYTALLVGRWRRGKASVTAPLRKNTLRSGERMVRVDAQGKPAHTDFVRRRRFSEATLVEAVLHTGRTHQIRVHAAHMGHPVAGDSKYGDESGNRRLARLGLHRLFLHASTLIFPWGESGKKLRILAPLDAELDAVLDKMIATD
ncbi:MAG: RluA family pseudouridine synthase [Pseudomonadota bacterium]